MHFWNIPKESLGYSGGRSIENFPGIVVNPKDICSPDREDDI